MTVNDRVIYLPYGVHLVNGSVLVPVRAFAEALGNRVDWSQTDGVTVTPGDGDPNGVPYTEDELYWMSRIISAESRGEPLLGKLAVGTVVLNRVASPEFPNTIYGVIFDRKWGVQFTPVANGTIYDEPTAESVLAAKMVLEGARVAENSLYFLAPDLTDDHWIMKNREYVTTIGAHWFYR
jgi:N-acetylmuramoyl-L-alanine amidase